MANNDPINISDMSAPWEQLQGEGPKPFEAFCLYRDMGKDRSYRKVAAQLGKSETIISRWGSKYRWMDRVSAWEAEIDRQANQIHMKDIAAMRARQAKQALALQKKGFGLLKSIEDGGAKLSEIVSLLKLGMEQERIAMGDVGEVVEERDGGPAMPAVQVYIPHNGRDEQTDGEE